MPEPTADKPARDESAGAPALLRRAIAGDDAALTTLLMDCYPRVAAAMRRRIPADIRGVIDAEDVLQEAHIEVVRRVAAFTPRRPDSFERWVGAIALSRLRNAIRDHRALKRGGFNFAVQPSSALLDSVTTLVALLAADSETPSRAAARHESVAAVREALELLPADYQEAVRLVYLQGLPAAQAAAQMGRTEQAVHNLCRRAKERLESLLGTASRYLSCAR